MSQPPAPSKNVLQALAFHQQGNLAKAHSAYQQCLREDPQDFHANHLLGVLLHQAGRSEQALPFVETATRLAPEVPDPWVNLGAIQTALESWEAAEDALKLALKLDPQLGAGWQNLGNLFQRTGRLQQSEEAYRHAITLSPDDAQAYFNLSTLLAARREWPAALVAAQEAIAQDPALSAAHGLVADCLLNLGDAEAALEATHKALDCAPHTAELWYSRGFALSQCRQLEASLEAFKQALALNPDHGGALSAALFAQRQLCQWGGTDRLLARFRLALQEGQHHLTPFSFLAECGTRSEQKRCAELWARQWSSPAKVTKTAPRLPDKTERLTIGYLSADFYRHPTAYLAAGLFELHDRKRFRIIAYSNSRDDGSPIRKRLQAAFDDFVDIRRMSTETAAGRIRQDGVDILVDLKGHTLEAATGVMALRPAPIQVQYLGYPGTMAMEAIDYLIGDRWVTPREHQSDYSEHLVQLPNSYQINDRARPSPPVSGTRAELGLPADHMVYCCFNNTWKLNHEVFSSWMKILTEVPDSVLWMLGREDSSSVMSNLRQQAIASGVEPQRLIMTKSRPLEAYLALYHHADLFLDTRPYGAHTTASDALWMGCPVLTLPGDTFASRVGASLLEAVELPQLICANEHEYQHIAVDLGKSPDKRKALRAHLHQRKLRFPLFDTVTTTRHIESAYEEMARRDRSGQTGPFQVAAAVTHRNSQHDP